MIVNGTSDRLYQKQMESKNTVKKPKDTGFEDKLKDTYNSRYDMETQKLSPAQEQALLYAGIGKMGRGCVIESISAAMISNAVSECEPQNVSLRNCDYVKNCIDDGYLLKAVISEDNNTIYIEQKFEDGTVNAYKVDMSKVGEETENLIEKAAMECVSYSAGSENTDESWHKALEEFAVFVKDRIKNGPPKIATGASELSIEEWDKLIKNIDDIIKDIKLEQHERFEKAEKEEKTERTPFDKFDGKKHAPYYEFADEAGIINYNGVTFVCDDAHGALCLGDMSDESNVLRIPLAGGGVLKVNRDNKAELARAIGMFSPEDMRRIMVALAQDNKVTQMEYEIEDTKNSIGINGSN